LVVFNNESRRDKLSFSFAKKCIKSSKPRTSAPLFKVNSIYMKPLTASILLYRQVLSIEQGTVQTGTGKVVPARKFNCTTAAHETSLSLPCCSSSIWTPTTPPGAVSCLSCQERKKYSTYSETAEPMIYLYLFINNFFIYLFIHSLACAFNKL